MGQYLRAATPKDVDLLFKWANDPLVRQNSFSTAQISYEEHTTWYDNLLKRSDCRQYIFMDNDIPVGQVRITIRSDEAEIGYSICAEKRSSGYGQKLLDLIAQKIWTEFPNINKVYGEVKPQNMASQKAFLHAGYTEIYRVFEMTRDKESD